MIKNNNNPLMFLYFLFYIKCTTNDIELVNGTILNCKVSNQLSIQDTNEIVITYNIMLKTEQEGKTLEIEFDKRPEQLVALDDVCIIGKKRQRWFVNTKKMLNLEDWIMVKNLNSSINLINLFQDRVITIEKEHVKHLKFSTIDNKSLKTFKNGDGKKELITTKKEINNQITLEECFIVKNDKNQNNRLLFTKFDFKIQLFNSNGNIVVKKVCPKDDQELIKQDKSENLNKISNSTKTVENDSREQNSSVSSIISQNISTNDKPKFISMELIVLICITGVIVLFFIVCLIFKMVYLRKRRQQTTNLSFNKYLCS